MYDSRRSEPSEAVRLPQPKPPEMSPGGFMLLPAAGLPTTGLEQLLARQWVYYLAFAQAQAVLRPSLPERDLLGAWN